MRKDKKGSERAAVPPKRGEAALEGTDKLLQTLLNHTHMLVAYLDPQFNFVRVNRAYAKADERDPSFFPGKNHFDLYPDAENEGIFKEVVKTGKPYFAYAKPFEYAEHPERGVSYWDWSLIPTKVPSGAVAGLVLTLVNVTERKREDEARGNALEQSQRHQKEITALLKASGAVLRYSEFPEASRAIFDSCKNLIGAAAGYVALLSEDGTENELLFLDSGKLPCTVDPSLPMPIRGLREKAYRTGQTVYHNDFSESEWVKYMPPGHATLDNVLFAPLMIEGKAVGLLGLANKPGGFSQDDSRIASAFGELAAVALRNSRTLEELEHSEERFRSVAQTANDAVITVGRTGNIVFWNRAAGITFGYSAHEAVGKQLTLIMPERFREPHQKGMKRVLSAGQTSVIGRTVEMVGLKRDSSEFPVELSIATWKSGGEVFFTGILRDITERKHVEEELQKQTHDLAERVKELNCLYNIGKLIETPGMALEQIFRGTVDLIPPAWQYPEITCARLALGDQAFATGNFRETAWRQLTDIVVHGDPVGSVEVCYLEERPEKDGGPFLVDERNLLKAIAERLGRVVERTQAREEIQKLNESLSAQAKELSAANKELEAFSYSASHDLRAPLRTIDGFSRALLEDYPDKLDETGKDYLRRVRSATQRMGELIDDLLNLSLTMRTEMRREETNLSRLATSIAAELQRIQPERGVEFVVQDEVLAQGDPRLLRELLENLLGNAWKFTGKNARPRIEFGITEKEGEEVYFVRDNGVGFDMTYADKLFIPFQRLHSDSEFSGNGIGLALVSRIVNRHGGRIWAEGEVEKGACFYFTLQ